MIFLTYQMSQVLGTALKKVRWYSRDNYIYNPLMRYQSIQYGTQLIYITLCHNFQKEIFFYKIIQSTIPYLYLFRLYGSQL